MRNTLVVLTLTATLVCATAVLAAPRALSSSELDTVAAGEMADAAAATNLLGSLLTPAAESASVVDPATSLMYYNEADALAINPGAIAVNARNDASVAVAGAIATDDGTAIFGNRNVALVLKGNVAIGGGASGEENQVVSQSEAGIAQTASGNAKLDAVNIYYNDVVNGSAMVVGDDNKTCVPTEIVDIKGKITCGSEGVIAGCADVCDSFNYTKLDVDICAKIDDSFNTTKNEQDVSGQCGLSAIVNATTLGNADIGANLNVTSAKTCLEQDQFGIGDDATAVPLISGNALAITTQNQVVTNNLVVGCSTLRF